MNRIGSGLMVALLGVAIVASAESVAAQAYLMPDGPSKGFWMEAAHPNTKQFDVTTPSTAWFLSGRHPLVERWWGVAELPLAYGALDVSGASDEGSTVFGNPYLGVEFQAAERVMLEAGLRVPLTTADEDSFGDVVGYLADPLRGEAFIEDVLPLSAAVNVRHQLAGGVGLRARGGVTEAFYTGDDDEDHITFLDYGVFATYPVRTVRLGAGVAGRWDATADEGSFSDNSLHQLGLSADVKMRRVRPGISVRVPLDESQRDIVRSTVGLYLQVPLPLR